jgi:hypothetical protein
MNTFILIIIACFFQHTMSTNSTSTSTPITYDGSCSCCWQWVGNRYSRVYDDSAENMAYGTVNHRNRRCTPPFREPENHRNGDDSDDISPSVIVLIIFGSIIVLIAGYFAIDRICKKMRTPELPMTRQFQIDGQQVLECSF